MICVGIGKWANGGNGSWIESAEEMWADVADTKLSELWFDRGRDGKSCGVRAYACGTSKSPAGRKRSRAEGGGLYIFRGLYPALHCVYLGDHLPVSTTVVDDWPAFCTVLSAFVSTILLEHG